MLVQIPRIWVFVEWMFVECRTKSKQNSDKTPTQLQPNSDKPDKTQSKLRQNSICYMIMSSYHNIWSFVRVPSDMLWYHVIISWHKFCQSFVGYVVIVMISCHHIITYHIITYHIIARDSWRSRWRSKSGDWKSWKWSTSTFP